MAYILPQVQVFQIFSQLPQNVVANLNAFVFGPQYQLFRYSVAAEKALIDLTSIDADYQYLGAELADIPWPNQPAGSIVDLDYVKVYAENLWAEYLAVSDEGAYQARLTSNTDRNKIRIATMVLKTANGEIRDTALKARDVQIGDRIRYLAPMGTSADVEGVTHVVGFEAETIPAVVDTATEKAGNTGDVTLASGGTYTGARDTTYVIEVIRGGGMYGSYVDLPARIRVTDTAGIDTVKYYTPTSGEAFELGTNGAELTITLDTGDLELGDIYYVPCTAATDGAIQTIVLADDVLPGPTTSDNLAVWFYMVKNGVEIASKRVQSPPDYNWTAVADSITVDAGMQVTDASWYDIGDGGEHELVYMDVYKADLFVEYRALLTTSADTIHSLTDVADVAATLGTIHPDNPLAQGVYNALLNSGDRAVYYMGLLTDDADGYATVLDRAGLTSDTYALAPLTRDAAILTTVQGHINSMSTESEKRWRIGFVGSTMPVSEAIYTKATNPSGVDYMATVTSNDGGETYTLVKFVDANGDQLVDGSVTLLTTVKAGDKVRVAFSADAWGDASYDEYTVSSVLTNTSLLLVSGPAASIELPSKTEVYHPYTVAEKATALANTSYGYYNRRMYNVFPTQASNAGVLQTGEFVAAAVAGLCSSVPPQQGLTNIELLGFDDMPLCYSTFNRTQLNTMAEYGTLIVMQDTIGARTYIRHQVSTKAKGNNLNETELSMVKNLDHISYYFATALAPYIGQYNVTESLLGALKTTITDTLNYLGSRTDVGLLGPQITLDETEIVALQQHPTLKDHILCTINIGLPAPFNVMELRLVV